MSQPFDDVATDRELEILTWDGFGQACRELARMVVASAWMPDIVIAVARGGLLPAGAISYALGVRAMGAMNVEFDTAVGETAIGPIALTPKARAGSHAAAPQSRGRLVCRRAGLSLYSRTQTQ